MRVMDVRLHPYRLKLKRPWVSAKGRIDFRQGWLISVRNVSGVTGWGDAAPMPEAGTEHPELCEQALKGVVPQLSNQNTEYLLSEVTSLPAAARCGVETALLDLQARSEGVSLAELLSAQRRDRLRVNAICGQLDDTAGSCLLHAVEGGFELVKFKVGVTDVQDEIASLEKLAGKFGQKIGFRLDANGAWNMREAQAFLGAVEGLPIESLEEPLAEPDEAQLEALQSLVSFPLALDESLARERMIYRLSSLPVRRVVLKPTVLGGPLAAMTWAGKACEAGLEVVITSTLESAVGLDMAAQVAAALEPDDVHGLNTGDWFESDVAESAKVTGGIMMLPSGNGIGVDGCV